MFLSKDFSEMSDTEKLSCNTRNYHNRTQMFVRVDFGYVPQTLILNVVVFLILVILFAVFRKRAWNYGRLALVQKTDNRWTQLFYSEVNTPADSTGLLAHHDSFDSVDMVVRVDNGFFSWLTATFRMKDHHIFKKCGPDAVQYLSFQRYVIVYLLIITVICLVIVLPVNLQGHLEGDTKSFGHTTISNLEPRSNLMWIHVVLSFLLLPLGVMLMRHFSVNLKYQEETLVSRTLMITHVPKHKCSRQLITKHFHEMYPDCNIQDIQFAYELGQLITEEERRLSSRESRLWCERYLRDSGQRIEMRTLPCNWLFCCCNCKKCQKVDAIDYYTKKEEHYTKSVEEKRIRALKSPLGIIFVTFETEAMAKRVLKEHQTSYFYQCCHNQRTSSLTRELDALAWGVYKAPTPEDIYWENLNSDTDNWYLRAGLINCVLFLILFFLTTPTIVLNTLSLPLNETLNVLDVPPTYSEMAAPMVLLLISVVLPAIVSFTDTFLYHWTRSSENLARMRKIFILLIFMVIILPSLGLVSAKGFFEWVLKNENMTTTERTMRWKCVFLPDNGAFFVNYVISSAFMGNAAELIRGLDLVIYVYYTLLAKSRAEQDKVQKSILWDFRFGVHYAWILLHVAITVIYSLPNPLVAPFGLLYMCTKHVIDRYNIYFVYAPSKINKQIHVTAINFLIFSIILLQIVVLFFVFIRSGSADDISAAGNLVWFSIAGCTLSSVLYIAHVFFKLFRFWGPISPKGKPQTVVVDESHHFHSIQGTWADVERPPPPPTIPQFFPGVLQVRTTPSSTEVFSLQGTSQRDYGSRSVGEQSPKPIRSPKRESPYSGTQRRESSRPGGSEAYKVGSKKQESAHHDTGDSFKVNKPDPHHDRVE